MWIWIAPLVLSYAVFVFIAEHINPFKKFREISSSRRIHSGRRAGLLALPLFFLAAFAAQFVLTQTQTQTHDLVPIGAATAAISASHSVETPKAANALITPSAALQTSIDAGAWIQAQNPNFYTLQLYLSNDRLSVDQFVKQPQLPQPSTILSFERDGATWYALVYGTYASLNQANSALDNLPDQIQSHSQWVRQFNELQSIVSL